MAAVRRILPVIYPSLIAGASVDNTAAISAAIATANTAGGGVVEIPAGTWYVAPLASTNYILAKSNVTLRGVGRESVIKVKADAGDYRTVIWDAAVAVTKFTVENLTIDQNGAGNTTCNVTVGVNNTAQFAIAIQGTNAADVTVRNCWFDTCTGVNTIFQNVDGCKRVRVQNCYFRFKKTATTSTPGYDNSAIYLNALGMQVTGNYFYSDSYSDLATTAIELHGDLQLVTGNVVEGYAFGVISVSPFYSGIQATNSDNTITGNTFSRCVGGVFVFCSTSASNAAPHIRNFVVANNAIGILQAGTNHDSKEAYGVRVANTASAGELRGGSIHHNEIIFESDTRSTSTRWSTANTSVGYWTGIYASPQYGMSDVAIEDNRIINAPYQGLFVGYNNATCVMNRVTVRRNRVVDAGLNTNASPASFRCALELTGAWTDCLFEDNRLLDTATGATLNGSNKWRLYPVSMTGKNYFRRNVAISDGTGTLGTLYSGTSGLLSGPDEGAETMTYAATIAVPDPTTGKTKTVALTGNTIVPAPAVSLDGMELTFVFAQDVTGTRTVTFNAVYKTNWTPSTTGSKTNVISFRCDGTNWIQTFASTGL